SDTSLPVMADGHRWPAFFARLRTIDELSALRKLPNIDFIEPARFRFLDSSSCTRNDYKAKALGSTDEQFHLDAAAGQIEASGIYDLVPYTFQHMGIVSAWRRLIYGTGPGYGYPGANAGIAVLDSGTSPDQNQLNGRFTVGSGRPAATHLTASGVNPGDTCGHGTRIAGLAAAPRDGINIVGVAWGAPLTTIKVD